MREATVRSSEGKLDQKIEIGPHRVVADEPKDNGGEDRGPAPHDFLLAALGSCTSMTVKLYAERKGWPLERVAVHLSQAKEDNVHVIKRAIDLEGPLSEEQRARLLDIAGKCPVSRTLTGQIRIDTSLDAPA